MKNQVDEGMAGGLRKLWKGVQEVGVSSFGKGALLAAITVVAVMALVGGYMGSDASLTVGQSLMDTFEKGMGAGISKGLQYLASGMGLMTMAAGGIMGTGSDIIKNQQKQAALESERLALEYQHSKDLQKLKQQSQHITRSSHRSTSSIIRTDHHHHQPKPEPQVAKGGLNEDGIYVKGSMIKDEKFCAAELKRRTERETRPDTHTVA